jgi:serine/threonine-protein kinase
MNESVPAQQPLPAGEPARRLWQQWRQGQRPDVREFLANLGELSLAQVAAVLRVDQRERWQTGERISAETYLRMYPALEADPEIAVDVVYGEFLLCEELGEALDLEKYLQRFPLYTDQLKVQVQLHRAMASDSVVGSAPRTPSRPASQAEQREHRLANSSALLGKSTVPAMAGKHVQTGRYEFYGEIGRGGIGAVLQARDRDLGRDLAVKVLLETHQGDAAMVQRFCEEAQIGSQLQHPGVAPVYELGQLPDRRPYFTMKLVKGQTLATLLEARADPTQDQPRFLAVFEQVCQTLAYAHTRGVIHRDLKPHNIMVGAFGEVQVMDWGLGKVLARDREADGHRAAQVAVPDGAVRTVRTETPGAESQAGCVMGTPAYMAPEQARGEVEHLDERCDVFGLGAILYEILTGKPPHGPGTPQDDLTDALARLDRCSADEELVRLVKKCLAVQPRERPPNGGVVAQEMAAYLASVQQRLRAAELARAEEQVRAKEAQAKAKAERRARNVTVALALSLFVVLLVVGGGWGWLAQKRAETRLAANDALEEAMRLRGQTKWPESLAAVRRAEELLVSSGGNADLLQRVREARVDLEMLECLADIRMRKTDLRDVRFDIARSDFAYAAAFQEYGMDVEALPPLEVAARIRARAIQAELVAALDDWASVRRTTRTGGEAADWQRLVEVAQAADTDPWRGQLRAALGQKEQRETLKELAKSADVATLPLPTLELLGKALGETGEPDAAVAFLQRVCLRHPDDFWINLDLGRLLQDMKPPRRGEAIRYLTAALALRGQNAVVYNILGNALAANGAQDEAIAAYREAISRKPDYAGAHSNLGLALSDKHAYDEAIAELKEAIRLQPDFAFAYNNLGHVQKAKGKYHEAITAFHQALQVKPDYAEAHYNLGVVLALTGASDKAIAAYRQAIHFQPDYADAYNNLGGLLLHAKGAHNEAIANFQEATRHNPGDALAYFNLGNGFAAKNALDEAVAAYRQATHLQPDYAEAYTNLGAVLDRKGLSDEAIAAHRRALSLRPNLAYAHYNLGNALKAKGAVNEAIAAYHQAIHFKPDFAEAHCNLGYALAAKGARDEAITAYRQAIHLQPNLALAHYGLGNALKDNGDLDGAIAAWRETIRLQPGYGPAYNNLAYVLKDKGALDEAVAILQQGIRLQPNFAGNHVNLGFALQDQGRFTEALAAFRRAHEVGAKANWRLPFPQWIRECERLIELDKQLPAILRDEVTPANAAERIEFALLCQKYKKLYGAAAHLFDEAFTAQPEQAEDLKKQHRYNGACAAALAGSGKGQDAAGLNEPARARWRKQALLWLQADLALWSKQVQSGTPQARASVRQQLQHWQHDSDLVGLRDEAALAKLPPAEQESCRKFWTEVDTLLTLCNSTRCDGRK